MTIYQELLDDEDREGRNDDNFEVSVTEKKLAKLFKNVASIFDDIIEIEKINQLENLDLSKLRGRFLIIFYDLEFNIDELQHINSLYRNYNISVIFCDCDK